MSKTKSPDQRVDRIMRRVRKETSSKELLLFGAGRAWSVVLIVGAVFFVLADRWARTAQTDNEIGS